MSVTDVEVDGHCPVVPVIVRKDVVPVAVPGQLRPTHQQARLSGVGPLHDQGVPLDSHLVPHSGKRATTIPAASDERPLPLRG